LRLSRQTFTLLYVLLVVCGIALLTASARAAPPAQDEGSVLTTAEYIERLTITRRALAGVQEAAPEVRQETMARLAMEWEAVTAVQVDEGLLTPIDTRPLVARLRSDPGQIKAVIQYVDHLIGYASGWGRIHFSSTDTKALKDILARPEFQWQPETPNPIGEFIDRLRDKLFDFLDRLFGSEEVQSGIAWSQYVWVVLGILAAGLVLAFASRGLWKSVVRDEALAQEGEGLSELSAEAAMRRAQELSETGDYRQGVRYLYLSALLLLEEHGLLHYDRWRTNREVLRSLATRPELAAPMQRVVEVFDAVWYGYQAIGPEEYAAYRADVDELRRQR
jgi:hypothetical protein